MKQTAFEKQTELIADIRQAIVKHILNDDTIIFNAIAKQKTILYSKNRIAIAIFLSYPQFKSMLNDIIENTNYANDVAETFKDLNIPVAFLGDLPIYVSTLLIDAPVFVVGGITWDLDG